MINNIRMAVKRFKRGISAKPIYDLNRNILNLINDLTILKMPHLSKRSIKEKKYIAKEIFLFKSNFLLALTYLKGKSFILIII